MSNGRQPFTAAYTQVYFALRPSPCYPVERHSWKRLRKLVERIRDAQRGWVWFLFAMICPTLIGAALTLAINILTTGKFGEGSRWLPVGVLVTIAVVVLVSLLRRRTEEKEKAQDALDLMDTIENRFSVLSERHL